MQENYTGLLVIRKMYKVSRNGPLTDKSSASVISALENHYVGAFGVPTVTKAISEKAKN